MRADRQRQRLMTWNFFNDLDVSQKGYLDVHMKRQNWNHAHLYSIILVVYHAVSQSENSFVFPVQSCERHEQILDKANWQMNAVNIKRPKKAKHLNPAECSRILRYRGR